MPSAGPLQKVRNRGWFVLLIAVHRDQPVIPLGNRIPHGILEALAVAAILRVPDDLNREASDQRGRGIRGAIIDDQHVGALLEHAGQDTLDIASFVQDRDGHKCPHDMLLSPR